MYELSEGQKEALIIEFLIKHPEMAYKKLPERIISAAVYYGGIISLPPNARHHHIIQTMDKTMLMDGSTVAPFLQGFLTDHGRFVNRIEAYSIAWAAKQIISNTKGPELFSEDLW